jgi:hypothetical protein
MLQVEIIEFRNQLAHAKECSGKKNALNVRNKERRVFEQKVFTEDTCKTIRELFLKHSSNLDDIKALLDELQKLS